MLRLISLQFQVIELGWWLKGWSGVKGMMGNGKGLCLQIIKEKPFWQFYFTFKS